MEFGEVNLQEMRTGKKTLESILKAWISCTGRVAAQGAQNSSVWMIKKRKAPVSFLLESDKRDKN